MKQRIISGIFIAVFFAATACFADDGLNQSKHPSSGAEPDAWSFFIGERTWQSRGDNQWNIAGTKAGGPPNVLSELEYLGLDSTIYEIHGGARQGRGAILFGYGFGSMRDGIYRDSDYLRNDRQGIFSLSTGSADGALYYWNIDYAYRLIADEPEQKFKGRYLDVLIGFQKWHEEVRMTKGVQEFGGTLGPFSGLNSTYTFDWMNYRIGLEVGLPVISRFLFKGKAILIPYNQYDGRGIWNLRTDFKQTPSFEHKASGGYGADAEASLVFRIYDSLTAELGYRYWYVKSGKGTDITYFSNGSVGITQFNEAVSARQGAFLDISYVFY